MLTRKPARAPRSCSLLSQQDNIMTIQEKDVTRMSLASPVSKDELAAVDYLLELRTSKNQQKSKSAN